MRLNKMFYLLVVTFFFFSCGDNKNDDNVQLAPGSHKAVAEEVLNTTSYTYVRVKENDKDQWLAITRREVKEGETYYYMDGMEMKNFPSKELNRTFDSILFIDKFSDQPYVAQQTPSMTTPPGSKKSVPEKANVTVEPVKGGVTIAELYANPKKYDTKTVLVRGMVTKYNDKIMGKNWVHIQDGTEADGKYDLTLTTDDEVKVGELVTFEGSVALNKDFGFGYSYEVLIELAKLQK